MSGAFIKGNQQLFSGKYADLTGKPSSANNYRISEEHMTIGTGNQTINVANTDRIIGLTFRTKNIYGSDNSLKTVIFGSNRDTHAVFIGRHTYVHSNFANFKLDITTTQIVISQYTTGWRSPNGVSHLQRYIIRLKEMVILRKEIN